MSSLDRPFNAQIFKIYLEYLSGVLGWDESRISLFLSELGVEKSRLIDASSWFSLEFADHFYDRLVTLTGEQDLALKAGRFGVRSGFSPALIQLCKSVVDPKVLYRFVPSFASHFSKAATLRLVESGFQWVTIESTPNPEIPERPYMCENRKGILTALPTIFDLPVAELVETECYHRGGRRCTYRVQWQMQSLWISHARALALGLFSALATLLMGSAQVAPLIGSATLIGAELLILLRRVRAQREQIFRQNEELHRTLLLAESKSIQLQFLGEVSSLSHTHGDPMDLSRSVVASVCRILGYDRSMFLEVDSERQVLVMTAFHGFNETQSEYLSEAEFRIDPLNEAGFFVQVVNTGKPVLVNDLDSQISRLSPRSQKFAKLLGSKSFVAVPVMGSDGRVLGVLAVDQYKTNRVITLSDTDVLMTLSEYLGSTINRARMVEQLQQSLQISREGALLQLRLREIFQKFVPSDIALSLAQLKDPKDLSEALQTNVKRVNAAILFFDIAGFSRMAQGLNPERVVELLNVVFRRLEPLVSRYGGIVDKFTGDGFLAVFQDPEGATKACSSALQIVAEIPAVCEELLSKNLPGIAGGVGINYGPVILGNVGSEARLNFTVIGEAVNLAARLESLTRQIGPNTICISGSVKVRVNEVFSVKSLGEKTVKGLDRELEVFQLLPAPGTESGRDRTSERALVN